MMGLKLTHFVAGENNPALGGFECLRKYLESQPGGSWKLRLYTMQYRTYILGLLA